MNILFLTLVDINTLDDRGIYTDLLKKSFHQSAEQFYDKNDRYQDYVDLYNDVIDSK